MVHPGSGTGSGTVVHGLLFHFQNLSDAGGTSRPGIVHRLDKKTSGLLMVAKNNVAHAQAEQSLSGSSRFEKTYIALVHGTTAAATAEPSNCPLADIRRYARGWRQAPPRGRAAFTEYRVMEEFRGFSLLEVRIKTGRTHQIRVHLSAIGHPVVGDDVYGERSYKEFIKKIRTIRPIFSARGVVAIRPIRPPECAWNSTRRLPQELQNLLESIKS